MKKQISENEKLDKIIGFALIISVVELFLYVVVMIARVLKLTV